jgi:hypothetical protein
LFRTGRSDARGSRQGSAVWLRALRRSSSACASAASRVCFAAASLAASSASSASRWRLRAARSSASASSSADGSTTFTQALRPCPRPAPPWAPRPNMLRPFGFATLAQPVPAWLARCANTKATSEGDLAPKRPPKATASQKSHHSEFVGF